MQARERAAIKKMSGCECERDSAQPSKNDSSHQEAGDAGHEDDASYQWPDTAGSDSLSGDADFWLLRGESWTRSAMPSMRSRSWPGGVYVHCRIAALQMAGKAVTSSSTIHEKD